MKKKGFSIIRFMVGCLLIAISILLVRSIYLGSILLNKDDHLKHVILSRWPDTITMLKTNKSKKSSKLRVGYNTTHKKLTMRELNASVTDTLPGMIHLIGADIAHLLSSSLHITKRSFMTGPTNLDNSNIIILAWIYLDVVDPIEIEDMRTVFSNKRSGCEITREHYGISMFVNAWHTSNHQLRVEFGGELSGCHKIDSKNVTIPSESWQHVAVSFIHNSVTLFVNGKIVNSLHDYYPHNVQSVEPFIVGRFHIDGFPLLGNISQLTILHTHSIMDEKELLARVRHVMRSPPSVRVPDLFASFPLNDAVHEIPNSQAVEVVQARHGVYTFPESTRHVAGLSIALLDGLPARSTIINHGNGSVSAEVIDRDASRAEKIRRAMRHAWLGYSEYALGRDELLPLSYTGHDNWGGMGVTLIDALDTLYLMGMSEEFSIARDWIADHLHFEHVESVSVFETTIRVLGGLLSAYDLSHDKLFLDKAIDLADRLLPAFDTVSGVPSSQINLANSHAERSWEVTSGILSEMGSLQLEFRYLSYLTRSSKYEMMSMKILYHLKSLNPKNGLFPSTLSAINGQFDGMTLTFGAGGDSFYEYLLKLWLQGEREESWLREMYDKAVKGLITKLLRASTPSGYAYISLFDGITDVAEMSHLVCFLPGTLALGAYTDPNGFQSERAQRDLSLAKALLYTCYEMYHKMPTKLAPESITFKDGEDFTVTASANFYMLRPEVVESLYYLYIITKEAIYKEWAWEIFEAVEMYCKTDIGYAAFNDVQNIHSGVNNHMESFFLAETLKYLYLIVDTSNYINIEKHIFNTEAHPFRIFHKINHSSILSIRS